VSVSPDAATQPVIRDEFTVTQYYYASPVACDWHSVSDVGSRIAPLKGASSNHNGTDIVCNRVGDDTGTPLLSIANGVVVEVGNQRAGIGSYMVIQHWTNGESFYTRYGHMIRGSQTLGVGSPVSIGQQVGSMGSTGTSNGAHLHLEIHMNGSPSSTSAVDFFIARSALTLPKF
jgi:murein DD-endopeptidase MepM/ murein hydrolase activator NlpD